MPEEKFRPTCTFTEDRLAELRTVVPEAFEDGAINWDTLQDLLAPHLADEGADAEHFGLSWPGKREARRLAAKPSGNTLHPSPGEGVNEATTHNLYLEGDNLEVLKLLQKSYAGRVKMIYIDPPYNTGKDFVYKDNFTEPSEDYLRRTGQMGERGELLTTNAKTDGRFHSNWLSMIYPRLRLARTLLREDGVIFVSIDDNEIQNLREVMSEVFGEENFIAQVTIHSNPRGRQSERFVATVHEYLLIFAVNSERCVLTGVTLTAEQAKEYRYLDERGTNYRLLGLRQRGTASRREDRPGMYYPIYVNVTNLKVSLEQTEDYNVEVLPKKSNGDDGRWMWAKKKVQDNLGLIEPRLISTRNEWDIFVRDSLQTSTGDERTRKVKTLWDEKEINYQNGTQEVKKLFGAEVAEFPKPVVLMKKIVGMGSGPDSIVLDFFSGSASTAQAILELNREDGGNRQFILTQLPEATRIDSPARKAGYLTMVDIGKERLRRVITEIKGKVNLDMREGPEDLGFKVLTLGASNFRAWRDYTGDNVNDLQQQFDLFEQSPLADGWTSDGLLTEVLLLEGFPLDSTITPQPQWTQNAVFCITSPACGHRLWTCFDETLHADTVEGLTLSTEDVFICRDSALDDNSKLRLSQTGTLKTI